MAIFYSIVEGKVMPTTHLYTQVSSQYIPSKFESCLSMSSVS